MWENSALRRRLHVRNRDTTNYECTSKLLLLETSSRELKDEVEDKQKVIEGLKKDIDVQDEILIQKELTIVKNEEELNEKLWKNINEKSYNFI